MKLGGLAVVLCSMGDYGHDTVPRLLLSRDERLLRADLENHFAQLSLNSSGSAFGGALLWRGTCHGLSPVSQIAVAIGILTFQCHCVSMFGCLVWVDPARPSLYVPCKQRTHGDARNMDTCAISRNTSTLVVSCCHLLFEVVGIEIFGNTPVGMPGVSLSFSSSCLACLCGSLSGKVTGCSEGAAVIS